MKLTDLVGRRVQVWSFTGTEDHWDDGRLEDVDEHWIRLKVTDGRTYLFPTKNVRLVKTLDRDEE
jgi:hypothetical protein